MSVKALARFADYFDAAIQGQVDGTLAQTPHPFQPRTLSMALRLIRDR